MIAEYLNTDLKEGNNVEANIAIGHITKAIRMTQIC